MKLRTFFLGTTFGFLFALAGCDRRDKDEPPPPPQPQSTAATVAPGAESHLPHGIDWFKGDVDAAFAAASVADKPVFLYWGAEWCPPCAQIKTTIFARREFQDRSKLFVPVYLDGDTPSAQKHGERFGVVGYPTMILFKPDGTEITRLPGGVDIARYAKILDVALADARPVSTILEAARKGEPVTSNDWRLLAYYSWGTDNGRVLPPDQQLSTFRALTARCPAELPGECARFLFGYLAAAAAASEPGKPALDGLARADARRRVLAALPLPSVRQANVDNLLYGPRTVIGLLSDDDSPERRQLLREWNDALGTLGDAGTPLSTAEQLLRVRARVMLAKLDAPDAPLPPALLDEARQAVAKADAATPAGPPRQAAINAAANLYWEAGLEAEANKLLTAELDKSQSPYYFMLDLADLAEKAGRKQEAVAWLERAYAGAQGPATRFQWGYNYLVGLLEMTPEDTAGIERAGLSVLGELDGSPDAFYQRTRIRLEQLDERLREWGQSGEAAKVIATLRVRTSEICRKLPPDDAGRARCEKFLNPAAKASRSA
jgi:thiol-disulfide isomerase/thioredoxin/tetratricopeptide (TPR) repeat protein